MNNNLVTLQTAESTRTAYKALTPLRAYGLTQTESYAVILNECMIAEDNALPITQAISPTLIEIFGHQHIEDALSYSYLYMKRFKISWETFQVVLNTLLGIYRPEELIVNPEKIRFFLTHIFSDISARVPTMDYHDCVLNILKNISDNEIRKVAENSCDEEFDEDYSENQIDE